MNCPWCEFEAGPHALHAHLGERHGEVVGTSERHGKTFYHITCPHCGARYEHVIRKGTRDPDFLADFELEIKMVALDMLLHHLMAEHEQHEQQRTGEQGRATGQ